MDASRNPCRSDPWHFDTNLEFRADSRDGEKPERVHSPDPEPEKPTPDPKAKMGSKIDKNA